MARKKQCSCQKKKRRAKISGMRGMNSTISTVAGLSVGFIGAKAINNVGFVSGNPQAAAAVKIVAGIMLPKVAGRSKMVKNIGFGMAAAGATDLLETVAPGLTSGGAISGYGFLPNPNANAIAGNADRMFASRGVNML